MPFPFIPAAITGVSLAGSLLGKKPKAPGVDPRLNAVIDALMKRSQQGLSPEVLQAFLGLGSQQIGQGVTSGRESIRRSLSAAGESRSGSGAAFELALQRGANLKRGNLAKQGTLLNENAKERAFRNLLAALGQKSAAAGQQFQAESSQTPNFGQGLGLGLEALLAENN